MQGLQQSETPGGTYPTKCTDVRCIRQVSGAPLHSVLLFSWITQVRSSLQSRCVAASGVLVNRTSTQEMAQHPAHIVVILLLWGTLLVLWWACPGCALPARQADTSHKAVNHIENFHLRASEHCGLFLLRKNTSDKALAWFRLCKIRLDDRLLSPTA